MAAKKSGTAKRAAAKKSTPKSAAKTARTVRKTAGKARGRSAAADYEDGEVTAGTPAREGGTLVIVESPAKAKTIGKYLGRGYRVQATVGHIMDLPEKKLGIDVDNGFTPDLVPIPGKEKTIAETKNGGGDSQPVLNLVTSEDIRTPE